MKKSRLKKAKNRALQTYYEKHFIFSIIFGIICLIIVCYLIDKYLIYIDKKASIIKDNTESTYTLKKFKEQPNHLYLIDLEGTLNKALKNSKQNTITYKIKDQNFYLDIRIEQNKDTKTKNYEVTKVVDLTHKVNAKIDYSDVKQIEFRSEPKGGATVLKFITSDKIEFLAMTDQTYYFLGQDIDEIGFENEEFTYKTVNEKYVNDDLKKLGCTQKVIDNIEGFSFKDPYYYIGRINFLDDYYQKIVDTTSSVEEKCKELQK